MPVAEAGLTVDYLLLAAPAVGTVVNVVAQLVLARVMSGRRLLLLVFIAFAIGVAATATLVSWALSLGDVAMLDALALAAGVLFVYGAAGLVLFALINLGETSLRIRMMRLLLDAPTGITRQQLAADFDDRALVAIRLRRLQDKAQARVVDGVYFAWPSFLFTVAAVVRLLKRVIYGRWT